MRGRCRLSDEGVGSAAYTRRDEVLAVMRRLATELHMTILVVTHEMGFAREVASRMVSSTRGRSSSGARLRRFSTMPSDPRRAGSSKPFFRIWLLPATLRHARQRSYRRPSGGTS